MHLYKHTTYSSVKFTTWNVKVTLNVLTIKSPGVADVHLMTHRYTMVRDQHHPSNYNAEAAFSIKQHRAEQQWQLLNLATETSRRNMFEFVSLFIELIRSRPEHCRLFAGSQVTRTHNRSTKEGRTRRKTLNNAITIHNVSLRFLLNQVFGTLTSPLYPCSAKLNWLRGEIITPVRVFVPYSGSTITGELNEREAQRSTVDTLPLPPTPNPGIALFNPVRG